MRQRVLFCGCGRPRVLARGMCARCYRAWFYDHSRFNGHRSETLARDGGCRICAEIERRLLIVHHRRPGRNRSFATLCRRCHPRVHFLYRLPAFASAELRAYWRELHPDDPEQLLLPFLAADAAEQSALSLELN